MQKVSFVDQNSLRHINFHALPNGSRNMVYDNICGFGFMLGVAQRRDPHILTVALREGWNIETILTYFLRQRRMAASLLLCLRK